MTELEKYKQELAKELKVICDYFELSSDRESRDFFDNTAECYLFKIDINIIEFPTEHGMTPSTRLET